MNKCGCSSPTTFTAGDHAREPNEEIENFVVPWNEAVAMIDRGEIEDGKTLIAILQWEHQQRKAK